jgi:hypothetical protein
MTDLDRLLRPDISHAAADAVQPPDFVPIERRGVRRRRTRTLLGAATVVVVLLGIVGSLRVLDSEDASAPTPVDQPQRSMQTGDGAIEPGTYLIPRAPRSAVDFTVTFPEGWRVFDDYQYTPNLRGTDQPVIEPFAIDKIYADACRGERGAQTKVGPSADDLVNALLAQPGPAKSGPVETTLGGYPATRIDLRVPDRLQSRNCFLGPGTGVQIWLSRPNNYLVLDPEGVVSVYVVDVDGERAVFTTQYRPARTSSEDLVEVQQVLDSIRIQK